jgi:hypothetical protein
MRRAEPAALRRLAKGLGIEPAFRAMDGTRVPASPDTLVAVLAAMGVDARTSGAVAEAEKAMAAARSDAMVVLRTARGGHVAAGDGSRPAVVGPPCGTRCAIHRAGATAGPARTPRRRRNLA